MARKAAKKTASKAPGAVRKPSASSTIGEVEQLVRLMVDNDLSELNIEEGARKILLKRGGVVVPVAAAPVALPASAPAGTTASAEKKLTDEAVDLGIEVKSPMVGTLYTAPSPDSDAYVSVGDTVGSEDVVCIVEAMKVMNEIKAECAGTIAEVCVKNAQPVEFGQVLFRVRPA
jgi:acetyl-CoA carboxylase biotin carboxyl carrier protein